MGKRVSSAVPVQGGDISFALKIDLEGDHCFCKYQSGLQGHAMLQAEKDGLEAIAAVGCIKTPGVLHIGKLENGGCLLLEYIDRGTASEMDMIHFGEQLARLHATKDSLYGWDADNFIGSLPQTNEKRTHWPEFYTTQRLIPQLKMARNKKLLDSGEIPGEDLMEERLRDLCSPSEPSLIHGDLWGGNYLISRKGEAYLIDPSTSFSHPGMDIAMSKLFGGFSSSFYQAYEAAYPFPMPDKAEIDLYQLYYLLVHLNLFGASYASSVKGLLNRYF